MAKYDIYSSTHGSSGYLMDLQDGIVENLSTRVVAPLVPIDEIPNRMKILNPVICVAGTECLLLTHLDGVAKSPPTCVAAFVQDFDIQRVCLHP